MVVKRLTVEGEAPGSRAVQMRTRGAFNEGICLRRHGRAPSLRRVSGPLWGSGNGDSLRLWIGSERQVGSSLAARRCHAEPPVAKLVGCSLVTRSSRLGARSSCNFDLQIDFPLKRVGSVSGASPGFLLSSEFLIPSSKITALRPLTPRSASPFLIVRSLA